MIEIDARLTELEARITTLEADRDRLARKCEALKKRVGRIGMRPEHDNSLFGQFFGGSDNTEHDRAVAIESVSISIRESVSLTVKMFGGTYKERLAGFLKKSTPAAFYAQATVSDAEKAGVQLLTEWCNRHDLEWDDLALDEHAPPGPIQVASEKAATREAEKLANTEQRRAREAALKEKQSTEAEDAAAKDAAATHCRGCNAPRGQTHEPGCKIEAAKGPIGFAVTHAQCDPV